MQSVRDLAMAIRSGDLSPVEHVDDVLTRLAGDEHNAVVRLLDDDARARARDLADELARGRWRGPLHGVAVVVKDLIDVAGVPTGCGSRVLDDAPPPGRDAAVVARLREAGAVVVAKTHTHEFAYGPTGDVAAQGPARNPHDRTRITGGSSSGSAAAVAAGHVPLGIGTDTGGSVRIPAALCGVVGLKPGYGVLPADGVFPLSETCDHVGVLAADVHGAAVAYDVLARPDGTGGGIQSPGVDGLTVGVVTGAYWRVLDPAIADGLADAAKRLEARGATVVEVTLPDVDDLAATYRPIVGAEAWATHEAWLTTRRDAYQPLTAERLAATREITVAAHVTARRTRARIAAAARRALGHVDVLLAPTTPLRATPIGELDHGGTPVWGALLSLTLPFNLLGWPAVSVPAQVDGLPAGVQVVGVRAEERGVLRVAAALA